MTYVPPGGYRTPKAPYSRSPNYLPALIGKMRAALPASNSLLGPLGIVGTKGAAPAASIASAINYMLRTASFATDNLRSFKVAWANWYANEQVPANASVLTISASIEYPAGTFTQIKFGGAVSGSAPAGTTLFSDFINLNIPNGAQFWVRYFMSTSATLCYAGAGVPNVTLGEACSQGGTNQTMGGIVPNNANLLLPFLGIFGPTKKRSIVIIGDSRQAGFDDNFLAANGAYGEMPTGLNQYGWINLGISGAQGSQYLSSAGPLRAQIIGFCTDLVNAYGVNDIFIGGASNAALKATQTSIATLYPTKRSFLTTIDPETNSTDNWATLVNQTVHAQEAVRVAYNTDVRAGTVPGYIGSFDCAAVSESSLNSGKWKVDGTANKYTLDGVHQSPFCYRLYSFALP